MSEERKWQVATFGGKNVHEKWFLTWDMPQFEGKWLSTIEHEKIPLRASSLEEAVVEARAKRKEIKSTGLWRYDPRVVYYIVCKIPLAE